MEKEGKWIFEQIGVVHSPYQPGSDTPAQGHFRPNVPSTIVLKSQYEKALTDIESFSHIVVLYAFDRSAGWDSLVRTPWEEKRHGLFATRSPRRPNPIALTVVEIVRREGNTLHIKGLDAFDGSAILDLKPYIPSIDSIADANSGWLQNHLKAMPETQWRD
jgi:tRNA-Thr(GGU) m(6)t(6)A37 methyltransferase TsaA